ncbi:hypothetical protein MY11210_005251 [Beauveria gryllotalpidicola]
MGAAISGIKVLIVPAAISLALFLIVTFAVLPLWRRYRARYSQYLPLDTLGSASSSLRDRITARLAALTLPSTWRRDRGRFAAATGGDDEEDDAGEELGRVGERVTAGFAVTGFGSDTVRLSRDLEEGFIDDTDSDDSD